MEEPPLRGLWHSLHAATYCTGRLVETSGLCRRSGTQASWLKPAEALQLGCCEAVEPAPVLRSGQAGGQRTAQACFVVKEPILETAPACVQVQEIDVTKGVIHAPEQRVYRVLRGLVQLPELEGACGRQGRQSDALAGPNQGGPQGNLPGRAAAPGGAPAARIQPGGSVAHTAVLHITAGVCWPQAHAGAPYPWWRKAVRLYSTRDTLQLGTCLGAYTCRGSGTSQLPAYPQRPAALPPHAPHLSTPQLRAPPCQLGSVGGQRRRCG